nr:bifunctional adenosylcobinamide kinase/adenosylcobinamide-phosphate guanylyltransferase [uncultured Bacillus sp.]
MAQHSSIIFITGGVRSGKSRFAERCAEEVWRQPGSGRLIYIASMQASDQEMKKRIIRHQEDRQQSGLEWRTWEKAFSIGELAPFFRSDDVVLLDCLTTWLNNELFFSKDRWKDKEFLDHLFEQMLAGISQISRCVKALIIVSNEVMNEPIKEDDLILTYIKLLGGLHQAIVAECLQAYMVEMGIPVLMKGEKLCRE